MSWINWGCGEFNAPAPWINVDVVRTPLIRPQTVVKHDAAEACYEIKRKHGSADRLYLGHVLEHMAWDEVIIFLSTVRQCLLAPYATVMVVGPDMDRILLGWKNEEEGYGDELVASTIEYDRHFQSDGHPDSAAARHQWNCTEGRVERALVAAGYRHVEASSLQQADTHWPLTSTVDWQCAVRAEA